ncbi:MULTISPECIES: class-III pyridoxal-phosphate-dependent aminotransferase [unclassified Brenneria]|uniref:class-III pyridoxal-phosphate-dependent aminotransferase n=1 Tax=unclassified Brenneria TaxID=2634434 RepID=UPI0015580A44|nr:MULTISPECIES: aspartate aminotransferase family protein [unclassified Brenneria]MBJ7222326.1 aspartate aminotransferase family protein [Brenneria sp. L3-3C-1]MEE3643569.1 aspartate aminotransferase family protein [Brenneria sp. L3_3C_1]MEE3651279.1 aspartate aminotransferase family protein [Brenneria sp. HEZEL_4_2_4]NPD01234.1 aspartate aminotransferase family protein [Brenneria sp. hezel4-2-4]
MNDRFESMISRYKGDGPYLQVDDIKYIDAASGTFNLQFGYTNKRIADKLKAQIDRCAHLSSAYTREISQCILKKLIKHTPENIDRIWLRDVSGSGAVECAIRMAQKYTGRSGVISLFLAHHGQSLATAQISGNAFRIKHFHVNIDGSLKIPVPASVMSNSEETHQQEYYPDIQDIYQYGSNENIACLIVEPILGNGGNIVLSESFYRTVREFCNRNGIILIADEVQTGFGRTGTFFASAGYAKALEPDIIVFAKGAGGIGIPTGGVLMRKELDVLESFEHSSTSGANPLSLVALNETVDILEEEGILDNVVNGEKFLRSGLLSLQEKYADISGVRGVGYMYGFDTPSPEYATQAIAIAAKHRLIIRGARYGKGKALKVRPPLICTREHLQEILTKLDSTFNEMQSLSISQTEAV